MRLWHPLSRRKQNKSFWVWGQGSCHSNFFFQGRLAKHGLLRVSVNAVYSHACSFPANSEDAFLLQRHNSRVAPGTVGGPKSGLCLTTHPISEKFAGSRSRVPAHISLFTGPKHTHLSISYLTYHGTLAFAFKTQVTKRFKSLRTQSGNQPRVTFSLFFFFIQNKNNLGGNSDYSQASGIFLFKKEICWDNGTVLWPLNC